jgi:hypothetical protein
MISKTVVQARMLPISSAGTIEAVKTDVKTSRIVLM